MGVDTDGLNGFRKWIDHTDLALAFNREQKTCLSVCTPYVVRELHSSLRLDVGIVGEFSGAPRSGVPTIVSPRSGSPDHGLNNCASGTYTSSWPALSARGLSGRLVPGPMAPSYSYPRVIHRSEESPQELLPAASVNNSARKILPMSSNTFFPQRENTHRPATNSPSWRESTPNSSPSSRAMCWSLTNTQWWTALSRSHYKTFAGISQRVFSKN